MAERTNGVDEKGLGARHLILLFLAGVAVCAVFFSLGFLVGNGERLRRSGPVTEQVTGPSAVPPLVNPPPPAGGASNPPLAPGQAAAQPPLESLAGPTAASPLPAPVPPQASAAKQLAGAPLEVAAPTVGGEELHAGFTVQVTASRTKQDAEAVVSILKARGYPVFLVTPEYAHANDNLFRVQTGPFKTRSEAEEVRAKLAKEGLFKDLFIRQ